MNSSFKLIDGNFTPEESKSVIIPLLNRKIDFHALVAFSEEIRFNRDKVSSKTRIAELEKSITEISKLIDEAEKLGKKLNVKSEIHIEMV